LVIMPKKRMSKSDVPHAKRPSTAATPYTNNSGTGPDHRREGRWSSGPSGGQRED
jgi:hypothetical protein